MSLPPSKPTSRGPGGRGRWIAVGLVVLPVLCCAGPALLGAAAFGSWLLNPWLLGMAALVVIGVLAWRHRHRCGESAADQPCCPPVPARPDLSQHHQER